MDNTMKTEISQMLKGIDRYNPNNLPKLEEYLSLQVKYNFYDLEANLALLKLYQFNPLYFKADICVNILIKALAKLPNSDFVLCKCLIDSLNLENETIQNLIDIHNLLETCQFPKFWAFMEGNQHIFDHVTGFQDDIRKYILYVLTITFQNVKKELIQELLNLSNEEFVEWMKKFDWQEKEAGYILFANQEENIKTRNITETIDFESVASVFALCR